uniref:Chaperone protein DnaJ n=1 Tax=Auxenochlorella protothecoides TaxID=3075 RepID=A0A1D2A5R0_AUXPR
MAPLSGVPCQRHQPSRGVHGVDSSCAAPLQLHQIAHRGVPGCSQHRSGARGPKLHPVSHWRTHAVRMADSDTETQDDYYSVLGISSAASVKDIKRAFRVIVKDHHPDISMDEEATDFQIFLNDVYETLMDPEKRAEYDAISGFQLGGTNPFRDVHAERDQVFVDEFSCIGCRNCNNVCPRTFEMEDEYGRARVVDQGLDTVPRVQEAIDTCPVSCIHWVSEGQLALLEVTMSRMERVAAWLILTGGGKGTNIDVFNEASGAWEKRQAELRGAAQRSVLSRFWKSTEGSGEEEEEEVTSNPTGRPSRRGQKASPASLARAARRWRDYQRKKRNRASLMLPGQ